MAELDFSHKVSEIPAGAPLPQYQRDTGVDRGNNVPDFQGATERYAEASNWMSQLGSTIALKSSEALAKRLGNNEGQNPHGNLTPSFTDFDKNFEQSYATQAQSTLGLEAQKLITQSNLEVASAPRLTPELIAKTQQSIASGLKNIFELAPDSIRPSMEHQYGSVMINQSAQLTERLLREQREDRVNNAQLAAKVNTQNALSLAQNGIDLDKNGDSKAGLAAVRAVEKSYQSMIATRDASPLEAKAAVDSARQSYLSGKYIRQALIAEANGKLGEFEKGLADHPPKDISATDHNPVFSNVMGYINNQHALRQQDEQLRATRMNVDIAKNVDGITEQQLLEYKKNVSPLQYEKTQIAYIQAKKANQENSAEQQDLIHHWDDPSIQARSSEKLKNKTFDTLTQNVMEKEHKTRDEAEVQVALSAGAPVPVFIKTLNDKATSGNPISIQSASLQIQELRDAEGGHALIGLSKQAQTIAIQFQHQRGSMPDSDLARKITDNIINIDSTMQTTLDNAWNIELSRGGASGLGHNKSFAKFALSEVKLNQDNLGGAYFQTIYGNDIYDQLRSNFDAARGDYATALTITKQYVDQNYGETRINGDIRTSDKPIEKSLGYKDPDVVPFIQQDLLNHLNAEFEKHKDEKNESWTIKPVNTAHPTSTRTFRTVYPPAEIIRTIKTDKGNKQYSYPVNLIGRPGNEWDVVLQTPTGPINLFLVAPHLGVITYKPNADEIRKNYKNYTDHKGWL